MLAAQDVAENEKAKAFHTALAYVSRDSIEVISTDRHLPRKKLAALARGLFLQLGIKEYISVTAPNYSMASSVHVKLPRRRDNVGVDGFYDMTAEGSLANQAARDKVEQILLKAFPNSDDRSDTQTDYFDFKWSID